MSDPAKVLKDFKPKHDFFIGIDSDGCVFDSMEIKHKECFCPAFINHFGLQPVSKYAREVWDFVNLYSTDRGINRFHAVLKALSLLSERKEVKARNVTVGRLSGLKKWMEKETRLGNPALKAELERNPDPDLKLAYEWSIDVNAAVEKIVRNVPPFPFVRECLAKIREKADTIVVSQTPREALTREWAEHSLDGYVHLIAGQEMGSKTEHITFTAKGKYETHKMLMVGDAPGDLKAARSNNALFFPINPGHEEEAWELFYNEALDRFFNGLYAGEYEEKLIKKFNAYLPVDPPWEA
ncbi:MAG: HAD family hydrolase [Spirochaetota bacterium]